MNEELAYWLALAHIPKIKTKTKNEIIVHLFEQAKNIIDFFQFEVSTWSHDFGLNQSEIELFLEAKNELPNYAFLVEDLLEQGYNILPITSPDYSPTLKKNLGRVHAPQVIYTKGNLQIMKEQSIAIVGSRNANDDSIRFTDNIAKKASVEYKVVVSGFAKGVDKQALDSALKHKGQSIIVLPQGIATFQSGFKNYYKQIINGDVLVLSTFYPKAPWSVQLAMARNPIIYGLASEIYVAESSEKGGTWSGVMDGLRKKRTIYVRQPNPKEKNANNILISNGGKAVDINGNITDYEIKNNDKSLLFEPNSNEVEEKIIAFLKKGVFSAKEIVSFLKIDWNSRQVSNFLKNKRDIITIQGKPLKFTHHNKSNLAQKTLFDNL
ncbi:MAG: DNA-processing protein DprA [Bacteroidales bacterium]|nr:DNA-processing protein DprA [Bacteroidales bacterium]